MSAVANYDDTDMTVNGNQYPRYYATPRVEKFRHERKQSSFLDA